MLITFDNNTIISEQEVKRSYPNSMYIMQDINDTKGILKAVSTSKDSYQDICILKKELADNNIDCALLGSYNTSKIGILNIN